MNCFEEQNFFPQHTFPARLNLETFASGTLFPSLAGPLGGNILVMCIHALQWSENPALKGCVTQYWGIALMSCLFMFFRAQCPMEGRLRRFSPVTRRSWNTVRNPGKWTSYLHRLVFASPTERYRYHQSINQSIILFSNAGLQSGSHKADVDLQRTNEI